MASPFIQKLQGRSHGWMIPAGMVATFALAVVNSIALLYQGILLNQIARKPPSTQVQLVNGRTILTEPRDYQFRSETVQRQFIKDILPLLLWKGEHYPSELGKSEPVKRVALNNGKYVPDLNFTASYALPNGWRQVFLNDLASDPTRAMASEIVLRISDLYNFQRDQAKPAQYTVDMTASLYYFNRSSSLPQIKDYNNRIHLRAVEPPTFPLKPTAAQTLVNGIVTSGLQIDWVEPLPK